MIKKIVPFEGDFPLSKAIIHDSKYVMEISGQIGINSETKELEEGIENQTSKIIEIIKEILENSGWNIDNIIKTRIFLTDMKDYDKMNSIYSKHFSKDFPTRVVVAVKELPAGALIEIECTAVKD
ncbi:MAG: Rid family detoxifying hydrolase [archaeon]|nr:Rid family detoxifying hydrolase [archaeon]MCR4323390.1 Rid family detoxifying hydrolase [Nanoarchaeota archaeon]